MPKKMKCHQTSRAVPYSRPSHIVEQYEYANSLKTDMHRKEWEETQCPICMDRPHNAVLLICSSYEKGCRPFMCNTSTLHSNCLDQFCNSQSSPSFTCPLCRGHIDEWVVIGPARKYMDSKPRSCGKCEFIGNYSQLRKHVRSEHPHVQPSVPDPVRQSEWSRLEEEIRLADFNSSLEPILEEGGGGGEGEGEGEGRRGEFELELHLQIEGEEADEVEEFEAELQVQVEGAEAEADEIKEFEAELQVQVEGAEAEADEIKELEVELQVQMEGGEAEYGASRMINMYLQIQLQTYYKIVSSSITLTKHEMLFILDHESETEVEVEVELERHNVEVQREDAIEGSTDRVLASRFEHLKF